MLSVPGYKLCFELLAPTKLTNCFGFQALHTMIEEAKQSGEPFSIHELARNGALVRETIIKMGGYQSISGNYIR